MKLRLKYRVLGLAAVAAILPGFVFFGLLYYGYLGIESQISKELTTLAQNECKKVAQGVQLMVRTQDDNTTLKLKSDLAVARSLFGKDEQVTFEDNKQDHWTAINQFTHAPIDITVPNMRVRGIDLTHNAEREVPTPIVDDITQLLGGTCTIFQRINGSWDFLRIGTSVINDKGKRAIGTYIPEVNPDGSPNPVIKALRNGETFVGPAFVVNTWYMAAYQPIFSATDKKNVVGALYVGVKLESVDTVRKAIVDTHVGRLGRVYVVGSKGERAGKYWVSPAGIMEEHTALEERDSIGRAYMHTIVEGAATVQNNEPFIVEYRLREIDRSEPHRKIAAVTYYAPWDWVIVAEGDEDDFLGGAQTMRRSLQVAGIESAAAGGIVVLLTLIFAWQMATRIGRPIERITEIAQLVADGELKLAQEHVRQSQLEERDAPGENRTGEETSRLRSAVATMTRNLNALVGRVKHSSITLVSTSTQLAATSQAQDHSLKSFSESTNQIAIAVKEISTTGRELVNTIQEVGKLAQDAGILASTGKNSLTGMELTIRQVSDSTGSITNRLSVINQKTGDINVVVTTISKVAEQTNLLSVNAAIEAEKAGEYGRGFLVVAREIRRLADQTAVATHNIDHMVHEMRSAVAAGVMEMDKFTTQVRRGVEEVAHLSTQLNQIIEQVQILTQSFNKVQEGITHQAQGVEQINDAMDQLSGGIKRSSESLQEINQAAGQLSSAVHSLKEEVSKFNVGE